VKLLNFLVEHTHLYNHFNLYPLERFEDVLIKIKLVFEKTDPSMASLCTFNIDNLVNKIFVHDGVFNAYCPLCFLNYIE
jgi:hypothetical protein